MPFAPRFASTRGGASRTGKKVSTSRTGIEDATTSVAAGGSRTPSSAATRGSDSSSPAIAAAIAAAARRSAPTQAGSQARSPARRPSRPASAPSAAAGSAGAIVPTAPAGSCHAFSGSNATCSAESPSPCSHWRSGFDVGRSPTRSTSSGRCAAAQPGSRSSAS